MKLSESYKSDDFETMRNQKILVVSRTPLDDVRKEYELAITKQLRAKGMNAVASHIAFPSLERLKNPTADRVSNVISMFREDGFDILVLTSLKDVQEQVLIQKQGGYNSLSEYYGNQYITLKGYYDDMNAPPRLPPRETPESTTVLTADTYILEAVTYNLAMAEEKRLLSIIAAEVTDPDSGATVRNGFAKIVANQLK